MSSEHTILTASRSHVLVVSHNNPSHSTHVWSAGRTSGTCGLSSSSWFRDVGNQPVFVVHAYPDDADAIFCQACGVLTLLLVPAVALGRGTVDDKV